MRHHAILIWLGALFSCAPEPSSLGPEIPRASEKTSPDQDGDGFPASEDCLDHGVAWKEQEPDCLESVEVAFSPSDGQQTKDFSLVEDGGTFHVFHIRRLGPWGTSSNETDFGHETSSDLITWTYHPPVQLLGAPGAWNDRNVWSPHVIAEDGTWHMFFTGVTYDADRSYNAQRIGRATSTDLFEWTLASESCADVAGPGCVLDCDALWTGWDPGGQWTGDCRDPWVLPHGGGYVMFLTTILPSRKQVVARAQSPDLVNWTLLDYVACTEGTRAESPAVIARGERYYLFWTNTVGVYHATATDPLGAWTEVGYTHQEYATELLPFPDDSFLYGYVDGFRLRFQRLRWGPSQQLQFLNVVSPRCQVPAASIHPGDQDPPNGVDDNCDGAVDIVYEPPPLPEPRNTKLRFQLEPAPGRF